MFFLGVLGIFQILFFPGIIFMKRIKIQMRPLAYVIGMISFSLVFNYCLVFLAVSLHQYKQIFLLFLVLIEIGWIFWDNRGAFSKDIDYWLDRIQNAVRSLLENLRTFFKKSGGSTIDRLLYYLYIFSSLLLAYLSLDWIIRLFIWNTGSVFESYDTIISWNKWAVEWANNTLPTSTWRYPQLLPANWSIIYVLMGSASLQFFNKALMPLFTLFILLMTIDLGFAKRDPGFFVGSAVTYLVVKKFLGSFLVEGLADLPSAFLAFSAIYFLLISQVNEKGLMKNKEFAFLMLLGAAGSAVTKQTGLLFLALFLLLFLVHFIKPFAKENPKETRRILWFLFLIILIIVTPWYLYKQVFIWRGLEKSEIQMITRTTGKAYEFQSIREQFIQISQLLEKYLYFLVLLIPLSFFMEPVFRTINLLLIFPFFISWGIFASYDFRNLATALPIFGMSVGIGINKTIEFFFILLKKIKLGRIKTLFFLIGTILLIAITGWYFFPADQLSEKQAEKAMESFSYSTNEKLISALAGIDEDFKIITNYPLDNLPGMAGKRIGFLFNDFEAYTSTIEKVKADKIYLLVPEYSDPMIMDDIYRKFDTGEFTMIFRDENWIPYIFIEVN